MIFDQIYLFLPAVFIVAVIVIYQILTRPKSLSEELNERTKHIALWETSTARKARKRAMNAPEQINNEPVIGSYIKGDMYNWVKQGFVFYPSNVLDKHAVILGASGKGKTETLLRIAYGAAKTLGWKVYYIDAKGDPTNAGQFLATMKAAGHSKLAMFPARSYNGWRGDATAIFNRLMSVSDFTEPFYKDATKMILGLAIKAPQGLPKTSDELLRRLDKITLTGLYKGHKDERSIDRLKEDTYMGVYLRYRGFFDALEDKLDGNWAFEDVDAAYILLNATALKEEARSLGRFFIEDFSHYISSRKSPREKVLIIIDEFSALSEKTDAANLFERIRSFGGSVIVSSQSYAGLGEQAERIISAASTAIIHQCADPEKIIALAGTKKQMEPSIQFDEKGSKGSGSAREQDAFKVSPNDARQLGVGEAFLISSGKHVKVHITRVEVAEKDRRSIEELLQPEQKPSTQPTTYADDRPIASPI